MIIPPKYMKYIIMAAAVAMIAVISVIWVKCSRMTDPVFDMKIESDKEIAVTPIVIQSIRDIRQWEFVKITDEEVIDTVRKIPLWPDHRLVLVFHGTPRIGIDLADAPDDWVTNVNDSLTVTLPQPRLLDTRFIDEALTEVFAQNGPWTASDREHMYEAARSRMTARALSPDNIDKVRKAAANRFAKVFESLGAKYVEVRFEE